MVGKPATTGVSLSDLPVDELAGYARGLGLTVETSMGQGELLRLIRDRRELLLSINRDALLDIAVWARLPVRRSASKESLARQISLVTSVRFNALSDKGLRALAMLRDVGGDKDESRVHLEKILRRKGGLWARLQRTRRSVVGTVLGKMLEDASAEGDYQFLPEDTSGPSLKETIADVGVVGGIAQKLRGAADQYVEQKLDEIERRIDRKLDEIDRRLGEWRDREVRNRLRIVKITLISAIVVAIISLGYDYLRSRATDALPPASAMTQPGRATGNCFGQAMDGLLFGRIVSSCCRKPASELRRSSASPTPLPTSTTRNTSALSTCLWRLSKRARASVRRCWPTAE